MFLTAEYLTDRHRYWIDRISEAGIWNRRKFKPVLLVVRPHVKSYLGLFQRRTIRYAYFLRKHIDRISINMGSVEVTERDVDDVLVHEMIHQYITQSKLRDTSSHGDIFRSLMNAINKKFADELTIRVRHKALPTEGPGDVTHIIIVLYQTDGSYFCLRVNSCRKEEWLTRIADNRASLDVVRYKIFHSNDTYFNSFPACQKRLRGRVVAANEFQEFCERYNMHDMTT